MSLRYLSVCSGIEAATAAWHPLGWEPVAFSEVDAFPSAVLNHHYPTVPNWGDMTKFQEWPNADVDVLVGGTPCQSFSVAGLRKGLDDPRGSLMLVYLAIARSYRPRWVVWENVPGVLSADGGRAFGSLLGGLGQLGYGFAYRVLDAQYFGVAQRRKRVFVVGHLGDWRRAAAVLFERASLSRHPPSRREAGQVAPTISTPGARASCLGGLDYEQNAHGPDEPTGPLLKGSPTGGGRPLPAIGVLNERTNERAIPPISLCLNAGGMGRIDAETETLIPAYGIGSKASSADADVSNRSHASGGPAGMGIMENQAHALRAGRVGQVAHNMAVRRLTPMECERLQGFPDGWTDVLYRGKPAADGPRYKALGNSMAVPVMRWIGERIAQVETI